MKKKIIDFDSNIFIEENYDEALKVIQNIYPNVTIMEVIERVEKVNVKVEFENGNQEWVTIELPVLYVDSAGDYIYYKTKEYE